MSAVVLYLASAMPTCLNGSAYVVKGLVLAFGEVQKAVVTRVQTPLKRQTKLDVYSNPISHMHTYFKQVVRNIDVPLWYVVDEQRATRFKNPYAFVYPLVAPGNVVAMLLSVVNFVAVFLTDVERWISKDSVNTFALDGREELQTVRIEQCP